MVLNSQTKILFPPVIPIDLNLKMPPCKSPRIIVRYSSAAVKAVVNSDDLLPKILVHLPIRSLVRFKSVSKRWLSLISDPKFCRSRSTLHPSTPSGIFLSRSSSISPEFEFVDLRPNPPSVPFESLELSVPKHGIVILQSCNGLLLCRSEGESDPKSDYYVYNPTTKQYRALPKFQTEEEEEVDANREISYRVVGLSLAFDPSRSPDYKVVCIRVLGSHKCQIEIYSSDSDSDSGSWKPRNGQFPLPHNARFDYGIYWKGAIHWTINWINCIYFDPWEDEVHELPMPGASDDWEARIVEYFGNCGEHLHFMESSEQQTVLIVYELKEDRSEWFEKYRVDLRAVLSDLVVPDMSPELEALNLPKFTVLAIVDKSEVNEDPFVILQGTRKAMRVNVNTGSFESLVYTVNGGGCTYFPVGFRVVDAYLYVESLACV